MSMLDTDAGEAASGMAAPGALLSGAGTPIRSSNDSPILPLTTILPVDAAPSKTSPNVSSCSAPLMISMTSCFVRPMQSWPFSEATHMPTLNWPV